MTPLRLVQWLAYLGSQIGPPPGISESSDSGQCLLKSDRIWTSSDFVLASKHIKMVCFGTRHKTIGMAFLYVILQMEGTKFSCQLQLQNQSISSERNYRCVPKQKRRPDDDKGFASCRWGETRISSLPTFHAGPIKVNIYPTNQCHSLKEKGERVYFAC